MECGKDFSFFFKLPTTTVKIAKNQVFNTVLKYLKKNICILKYSVP